jgi:hypothetical protein
MQVQMRQVLGQLASAVLVSVAGAARRDLLAGFLLDGLFIHRHPLDALAEEQPLRGIEPPEAFTARAVEAAQQGRHFRLNDRSRMRAGAS